MFLARLLLFLVVLLCFSPAHAEDLFIKDYHSQEVLVVKVVAADTIVLENGKRYRLIGIENIGMPAKKYIDREDQGKVEIEEDVVIPLEEQALAYAQEILERQKVRLEYDIDGIDMQGYPCAYVFLPDGRMANAELLRMGFVHLKIAPPNIKYADQLRKAYQEAKQEKRGIQGE